MKKIYLMPKIWAVEMKEELMQFASGEQDTTPVDPGTPKDPEDALSREYSSFSIWDE